MKFTKGERFLVLAIIPFIFLVIILNNVVTGYAVTDRLRTVADELPAFDGKSLSEGGRAHFSDCYEENHSSCWRVSFTESVALHAETVSQVVPLVKYFSEVEHQNIEWHQPLDRSVTGSTKLFVRNNRKYQLEYFLDRDRQTVTVSLSEY